jgi:hypothetical protein
MRHSQQYRLSYPLTCARNLPSRFQVGHLDFAMGHRAAKVDANQKEIVEALRSIGATVQHLHGVAQGCPDLLVGRGKVNYLLEIKDGSKPPSARKLTPDQVVWHSIWQGTAVVVSSIDEAIAAVGGYVV